MKTQGGKSAILLFLVSTLLLGSAEISAAPSTSFADSRLARSISMDDGLPSNFIDDLFRDDAGFMWIATSGGGLCRYDGYDFLVFSTNSSISIKNNFVRHVAEDNFHRLWIASEGGLDVLDLDTFSMLDLSQTLLDEYQYEVCSFLTVDSKGCVWARSGSKILRVAFSEAGDIQSVDKLEGEDFPFLGVILKDVEEDGTVWAGISGRVCKLVPSGDGKIAVAPVLEGFTYREDAYLSDYLLKENEVWISTADGLYRYHLNTGQWKQYTYSPDDPCSLTQNFITGLAITDNKQLLAISLKGVNVYDPMEDNFERISAEPGSTGDDLLRSDFINCVKVYGGTVWLGTETAGVTLLDSKVLSVENLSHNSNDRTSIGPNPVNALFKSPDGTLWIGNVEGGLSYGSGRSFSHITRESDGISHNSVSTICSDPEGRIWIGTWGGGVDILDVTPSVKVRRRLVADGNLDNPLSYVGAMVMDYANDLMWIGTNAGIFYYDLATDKVYPALKQQANGCVGACIDDKGRLWMGSQAGVFVFDLRSRDAGKNDCAFDFQNFKYKLDDPSSRTVEKIYDVYKASDGTVWLGSYGNGFYKAIEDEDGSFTFKNYSSADGLVNDGVKCILDDASGDLWISTENGISRFNPSTGSFNTFSKSDGLTSSQFYLNAALRDSSGLLYFGHTAGLSIIDPMRTKAVHTVAAPCFTRISVADRVNYSPYPSIVRLHERDRSITFEFSALTFDSKQESRYAYCLEGQDLEWVELPAGSHSVNFTSMRPGKYTLKVRLLEGDDTQCGICEVPVRVVPYFYHSWWFYLLSLLILIVAFLIYQDWRVKNLVRQREELQAIVDERTREIKEQNKLIEEKAEELARQNRILTRQNEELAGHRILFSQDNESVRDDKFVSKAVDTVRELYKDPDLDVTTFCSAMGMSKTLLNKRLQDSLGQSIGQFIRTYRLNIAREMLVNNRESKSMNISEIAYESGFNDPKYFTRCFTKEYGMSPSSYLEN